MQNKKNVLTYIICALYIALSVTAIWGHISRYDISVMHDIYELCIIFCIPFLLICLLLIARLCINMIKAPKSEYRTAHIAVVVFVFIAGMALRLAAALYISCFSNDGAPVSGDNKIYFALTGLASFIPVEKTLGIVLVNVILSVITMAFIYVFTRISIGRTGSAFAILLYAIMPYDILKIVNYSPALLSRAVFFMILMLYAVFYNKFNFDAKKKSAGTYVSTAVLAVLCGMFFYISPVAAALMAAIFICYQFKGWLSSIIFAAVSAAVSAGIYFLGSLAVPLKDFSADIIDPQTLWNNFTMLLVDPSVFNPRCNLPYIDNSTMELSIPYLLMSGYIFIYILSIAAGIIMITKKSSYVQVFMLAGVLILPVSVIGAYDYNAWFTLNSGMTIVAGYGIHYILKKKDPKKIKEKVKVIEYHPEEKAEPVAPPVALPAAKTSGAASGSGKTTAVVKKPYIKTDNGQNTIAEDDMHVDSVSSNSASDTTMDAAPAVSRITEDVFTYGGQNYIAEYASMDMGQNIIAESGYDVSGYTPEDAVQNTAAESGYDTPGYTPEDAAQNTAAESGYGTPGYAPEDAVQNTAAESGYDVSGYTPEDAVQNTAAESGYNAPGYTPADMGQNTAAEYNIDEEDTQNIMPYVTSDTETNVTEIEKHYYEDIKLNVIPKVPAENTKEYIAPRAPFVQSPYELPKKQLIEPVLMDADMANTDIDETSDGVNADTDVAYNDTEITDDAAIPNDEYVSEYMEDSVDYADSVQNTVVDNNKGSELPIPKAVTTDGSSDNSITVRGHRSDKPDKSDIWKKRRERAQRRSRNY